MILTQTEILAMCGAAKVAFGIDNQELIDHAAAILLDGNAYHGNKSIGAIDSAAHMVDHLMQGDAMDHQSKRPARAHALARAMLVLYSFGGKAKNREGG